MYTILYNPLSNGGRGEKKLSKLKKILNNSKQEFEVFNLIEIENIKDFINKLSSQSKVIIVGGDGTLNSVANVLQNYKIQNELYLYQAGTGNDFARNYKKDAKKGILYIHDKIFNLPTVRFNEVERIFLNGCGLGVDGLVCHKVNSSVKKKNTFNYYKCAMSAFRQFKPSNIEIMVDGKQYQYEKVWLATIMNGKYIGGGMKMTPFQSQSSDELTAVVVNRVGLLLLFLILPTIYLGWHRIFSKYVHFIKGKHIKIIFPTRQKLQIDGEVSEDVSIIEAEK